MSAQNHQLGEFRYVSWGLAGLCVALLTSDQCTSQWRCPRKTLFSLVQVQKLLMVYVSTAIRGAGVSMLEREWPSGHCIHSQLYHRGRLE